ncbi:hypothetical protein BANRA_05415 [Escherichia coli]|nr:hypothetical protein BANRA_05415 [Escherichia coli]
MKYHLCAYCMRSRPCEHWSHVAGYWPSVIAGLPLMHLFHGHGGHGDHQHPENDKKLIADGSARVQLSSDRSYVASKAHVRVVISGCRCPERQRVNGCY